MSNVFVKGTAPFYPVPQYLVDSGKLKELTEGAHKLYQLLLFSAQQKTKVTLELSNHQIHKLAGLSPNTIRRARTELWEAGLVQFKRAPGDCFSYTILNPLTGNALPGLRRSREGSVPPVSSSGTCSSPSWGDLS